MRSFKFLLAAFFFFFASLGAVAQSGPLERNNSERQLFELLNHERGALGLPALQWDNALFKAARQHALRMADLNIIEHQLPNEPQLAERLGEAGARFAAVAENIAVGPNPQAIHAGWMDSPGHRKNILDPKLSAVGIAAVRGSGGLFAVEDFSQAVANLSLEEQERKVASALSALGLSVRGDPGSVRKSCERDALGATGARSMMRFETSDLSKLPEDIERKIKSQPFRSAAVGACRVGDSAGFTAYRIAVVFF